MAGIKTITVLFLLFLIESSEVSSQNILTKLEQGMKEILDILKERERNDLQREQDKVQETVGLLNMDSTLKRIEQQTSDMARQLRTATGRSGVATGEVQNLEVRIDTMEDNVVANVKGGLQKIDDVKKQADAIKLELEKRLGKMMNMMSAVHKELSEKGATKQEPQENGDSDGLFESEQIEGLERKVIENLSVTKETLTSEIRNVKLELLEPFLECKDIARQVEDMKNQCEVSASLPQMTKSESEDSSRWLTRPNQDQIVQEVANTVMRNLTRVQREINDTIARKLQELENKITENLISKSQVNTSTKVIRGPSNSGSQLVWVPVPSSDTVTPTRVQRERQEEKQEPKDCRALRYEVPKPHSCYDLKIAGASCSGQYIIFPKGEKAVYAYCDMTTDGGGWTVLMRRGELGSQVNFDQSWQAYKSGFGDINGEFWLGNDHIRLLTSGHETMILQVTLEDFDGNKINITYDQFWIEPEESLYRIHLGNVIRSQNYYGSSFQHHNGRPFTTHDRNNEGEGFQNCAIRYRGGWWYNRCHYALLTAPRFEKDQFRHKWQGIQWHSWKGNEALKAAEMKIRPRT